MTNKLKEKLFHNVVIFDGGIGSEIYKKNFFVNVCYEELSLSSPKIISQIHRDYLKAGAEVITANSFGANRNKLSKFGFGNKVKEINEASVKLAKEVAGDDVLVAGSVGPIGDIPDNTKISQKEIIEMLEEQIAALLGSDVDFIIFETLSSLDDINYALKAIQKFKVPYVISLKVNREGESSKGEPLKKILKPIYDSINQPTAVGLNCGLGPDGMLNALEILIPICTYPIMVLPNAGIPKIVDNRTIYMTNPEYFTTYAIRYVNLGIKAIGGCCGTTPEHIKDLARTIKPLTKRMYSNVLDIKTSENKAQVPTKLENKSLFGTKLAGRQWIKTVELVPPKGYELEATIKKAIICKNAGVDAINIPDGPRASSRISPLITALAIKEKAKVEPILHFCSRDRNLIGMQSDLLGCAAVNVKNLLFITGDPPKLGDYPFASAVFDADSIGLVKIQANLNRGIDIGGNPITKKTEAVIGVGADPSALDMKREIDRVKEKVEAGAEYIITQPIFNPKSLFTFLELISKLNVPVIAGVWPLASYRNAEFMKNEVPGVLLPDSIMQRMAKFNTKESQLKEGIAIARECISKIKTSIQGVQISAPFGNVDISIAVLIDF